MPKRSYPKLDSWLIKKGKSDDPTDISSVTNAENVVVAVLNDAGQPVEAALNISEYDRPVDEAKESKNVSAPTNAQDIPSNKDDSGNGSKMTVVMNSACNVGLIKSPSLSREKTKTTSEDKGQKQEKDLEPHQPKCIPSQKLGNRRFNFNQVWYKLYPWLHYDSKMEKMVCISCSTATKKGLFKSGSKLEETFVSTGYSNWKHGSERFKKHNSSQQHRDGVNKLLLSVESPIVKKICSATLLKQDEARNAIKVIFTSIMYLSRQGLAIRGSEADNGNFHSLLHLRAQDVLLLRPWLNRKKNYTSPEIQNEILEIISHSILRKILADVKKAHHFSIIVDETTDLSVQEQVSFSVRIVNEAYEAEEYFLGLYETGSTTGETLYTIIMDILRRFDLSVENLRGQCYDGAANMSGQFKGVQSRILKLQPKAMYVHCFNHSLNLALQDCISKNSFFRDLLSTVNEIGTIVSASPKRSYEFSQLVSNSSENPTKPRPLCPTRWTVRLKAIECVISGYSAFLDLMETQGNSNQGIAAKAKGIGTKLENGEFYLGLLMARSLFSYSEKLSTLLQNPKATVGGGISAAFLTIRSLNELRKPEEFDLMWLTMINKCNELDLQEPVLPRVRRKPSRYQIEENNVKFSSAKERLQALYVEGIDSMCKEIMDRFDQPGLKMLETLENLLLSDLAAISAENLTEICDYYSWNIQNLRSELSVLKNFPNINWSSVKDIILSLAKVPAEARSLFPIFDDILRHLIVVPCSSAGAERSFSRLRRVKSYLRTTMGQARLNHCCIINCYSEILDDLNVELLVKEFVVKRNREATFGVL